MVKCARGYHLRLSPVSHQVVGYGLACLVLAIGAGCEGPTTPDGASALWPGLSNPTPLPGKAPAAVIEALERGEERRLLVVFDEQVVEREAQASGWLPLLDVDANTVRRAVLFATAKDDLLARRSPGELQLEQDFDHLPITSVRTASSEVLADLLADPRVAGVFEDQQLELHDVESFALVGQPAVIADGKDGTGTAVAVLDTGADYTRAELGSCTAPGVPASCRVAFAQDFATQDNLRDTGNFHGTNVAGIIAGMAPGTKVLALDVVSGTVASSTSIVNAINWVVANRATYNIVAINLSLGAGAYSVACPSDPVSVAIGSARAAGILSVASSGNNGYLNATGSPACSPSAISVGAVYDANLAGPITWGGGICSDASPLANRVACFSNSASFLTLLAPGALITAAGVSMGGTSQAAPHVSGALGVVRGAFPTDTLDEAVARLSATGQLVTDLRNGRVTPRLDLGAAAAGCFFKLSPAAQNFSGDAATFAVNLTTGSSCQWSIASDSAWMSFPGANTGTGSTSISIALTPNPGTVRSGALTVSGDAPSVSANVSQGLDLTAPTGTVVINSGGELTRTSSVSLAISASDPSGVTQMCVSNGTTCTAFEPFATARLWAIIPSNGLKKVTVFLRDGRGNTTSASTSPSDTIVFDNITPTNGVVTVTGGDSQLSLAFSGFSDPSGIDRYRVVFAAGPTAPTHCAAGTQIYEGEVPSFVHSGLTNGALYSYRVCAFDSAGNLSSGTFLTRYPAPEYTPPTGTVLINGGAGYTGIAAVTLTLSASDENGVAAMCVSSSGICTVWQPFAATRSYTLPAVAGVRTVNVWFKDGFGTAMTSPASATIVFDRVAPANGLVTGTGSDAQMSLSWSGFTDTTSGIDRYLVAFAIGPVAPTTCAGGSLGYEGSAPAFVHTGLTNGTVYSYRVCAVDKVGNRSSGAVISRFPAPEYTPPSGTVVINGGATHTRSTAVTLTLSATDENGVAAMCVSNNTVCTAWVPFAASKSFVLPAMVGVRTVYVRFKDTFGTVSTPATATIIFDSLPPANGKLTATGSDGQMSITWTGYTDPTSGIDRYRLVSAVGLAAPASCAAGTQEYEGSSLGFVHTGLTNGTVYAYRVCAIDRAGNMSSGAVISGYPAPEYTPPTGTVVINGGAGFTNLSTVTLTLSSNDGSGVVAMCLSNTTTCTAWEPFATTKTFTLTALAGVRTVYVRFKDSFGTATVSPVTDTIIYDRTPPAQGRVSISGSDSQLSLSWSGFADPTSGIDKYLVYAQTGTSAPAATCATGIKIAEGLVTSAVHDSLVNGTVYSYRVCAVDRAGNVSTGLTASRYPAPEYTPPTGTVAINSGVAFTRVAGVTLTLSGSDASGVDQMCLSSSTTCSAWEPYATTKAFTLPAISGPRKVYAWFKDSYGTPITLPASATIIFDPTAPAMGMLSALVGPGQVALTWTPAGDSQSGIASYRLVFMTGATVPAPGCTTGTELLSAANTAFTHTGLVGGTAVTYRLCAVDGAGNVATGVAKSVTPL